MKGTAKSATRRMQQERTERKECKVLNCSVQKGTANPPNRNPNAANCHQSHCKHVVIFIRWQRRKRWWKIWEENTGEAMAREECKVLNWYVFSQFRFLRLDDWNQIHFGRHILLDSSALSCPFLEFQSVLETPHSGGCYCFLRICLRRFIAISTLKLDDWNQIHFGHTFCWLSRRPHVCSWKFRVF